MQWHVLWYPFLVQQMKKKDTNVCMVWKVLLIVTKHAHNEIISSGKWTSQDVLTVCPLVQRANVTGLLSSRNTLRRGYSNAAVVPLVSASVSVSRLILVNVIATKLLCTSSTNLADMLTMTRGWTLLILEVRGQRSRSQLTYMEIILWTR